MILFLAAQEHIYILDFLSDEGNYTIKKIAGTFSLKKFVIHDMRNFSHCSEIFLDRKAFMDSDEEFVSAIDEFHCMYEARVSVICEGLSAGDFLMRMLTEKGIVNIITGSTYVHIKEEIEDCLGDIDMTKYLPASGDDKVGFDENYKFNADGIKIAVYGTQARIGTTTIAIGLTNWLSHSGASACYIEANTSECLRYMGRAFEMKEHEGGYMYEGAVYQYTEENAETHHFQFLIYDYGTQMPEEDFAFHILVCGIKPYELVYTIKALERYDRESRECKKMFPFTDTEYRNLVIELFREKDSLFFSEYQPNCFDFSPNRKVYFEMMKKYIVVF